MGDGRPRMRRWARTGGFLVIWLGAVLCIWQSSARGTRVCRGCRVEERVVQVFGHTFVAEQMGNECSNWVLDQVPEHRHGWTRSGCWESGSMTSCHWGLLPMATPWLDYLQGLSAERLRAALDRVAHSRLSPQRAHALWERWRAKKRRDGLGNAPPLER